MKSFFEASLNEHCGEQSPTTFLHFSPGSNKTDIITSFTTTTTATTIATTSSASATTVNAAPTTIGAADVDAMISMPAGGMPTFQGASPLSVLTTPPSQSLSLSEHSPISQPACFSAVYDKHHLSPTDRQASSPPPPLLLLPQVRVQYKKYIHHLQQQRQCQQQLFLPPPPPPPPLPPPLPFSSSSSSSSATSSLSLDGKSPKNIRRKRGRPKSDDPPYCAICFATKSPTWRKGLTDKKNLCNCCGLRLKRFLEAAKRGRTANNCPTVIPFVAALKQTLSESSIPAHELAKARSIIAIFEEMISESSRQTFPLKGEQAVIGSTGKENAIGGAAFPVPVIGGAGQCQRSHLPEQLEGDSVNAEASRSLVSANYFVQDSYYGEMGQFSPYMSLKSLQQDQEQMTRQMQNGVRSNEGGSEKSVTLQNAPVYTSSVDDCSNGALADNPPTAAPAASQEEAPFTGESAMVQLSRLPYSGASPFMFPHASASPLFIPSSKEQSYGYEDSNYPEYSESFL